MHALTFTLLAAIAGLCQGNDKCIDRTYQCFQQSDDRQFISSAPTYGSERYYEQVVIDCWKKAKVEAK